MNRIYRLVWNRALHVWQVASELATPCGSSLRTGHIHPPTLLALAAAISLGLAVLPVQAAVCPPPGGTGTYICGKNGSAGWDGSYTAPGQGGLGSNPGDNNGGNGGMADSTGHNNQGHPGQGPGASGAGGNYLTHGMGSGGIGGKGYLNGLQKFANGGGGGGGGGVGASFSGTGNHNNAIIMGGSGGQGGIGAGIGHGGAGGGGGSAIWLDQGSYLANEGTGYLYGGDGADGTTVQTSKTGAGDGGQGASGIDFHLTNNGIIHGGNGGIGAYGNPDYPSGILPGENGGSGGAGVGGSGFALDNSNTISGGAGGDGGFSRAGGTGGAGVVGERMTLDNQDLIHGGDGGSGGAGGTVFYSHGGVGSHGGIGGAGIRINGAAESTLENEGTISGGQGGVGGDGRPYRYNTGATGGNGGTGVYDNSSAATLLNSGTVSGGAGGSGGAGYILIYDGNSYITAAGRGGEGGLGIYTKAGGLVFTNEGSIKGGAGGTGGANDPGQSNAGDGGTGGAAISGYGFQLTNDPGSSIVGGAGGAAGGAGGHAGTGGIGIISTSGSTIITGGAIIGGLSGDGETRAQAINFSGGGNTLTLENGFSFQGDVVSTSGDDTLALGGDSTTDGGTGNGRFDMSHIAPNPQGFTGAYSYSGFGQYAKTGTSTWTLTGTTLAVTPWTIDAGILSISSDKNLGAASGGLTFDGGTLENTMAMSSGRDVTLNSGGGTFQTDANLTLSGIIGGNGGLTKTGSGTLILATDNNYAGGTTIDAGILSISSDKNLGVASGGLTFDGGTLENTSTMSSGRNVTLNADGGTFQADADLIVSGNIGGNGGLTKTGDGTLVLTGANAWTGGTTIEDGTLQIGNGGTDGGMGSGDVTDNGALVFDLSNDIVFGGAISGSGILTQTGAGVLTLNGASDAFAGDTDVRSGTLIVGGSAGNGAVLGGDVTVEDGATLGGHGRIGGNVTLAENTRLAPGNSIGTLTVDGDFTAGQGSQFDFEFGTPGTEFGTFGNGDSVIVGGDLALDGVTLNVIDAGDMGPGLYNLFTYGGTLDATNGGLALNTTTTGETLLLQTLTAQKQINLIDTTGVKLDAWNANGKASTTRMGGGDGTWSAVSKTWTDTSGILPNAEMQPQPGFALFGGDAGTVTVDDGAGDVGVTGMQFAVDGYNLTGDTLTLVNSADGDAPVIRVGDGSSAGTAMTATIDNALAGSDGLVKADLGTLVLMAANTWSGGTTISAGTLQVGDGGTTGSIVGDVVNNGTLVFDRSDDVSFDGVISGAGALVQQGRGTLTLTGASTYSGATTVRAGTLVVGDDDHAGASLSGLVTVNAGATLGGIGTIGGLDLAGTLATGNSIGTLHVTGDATFGKGAIWQIEASPDGTADALDVGGQAALDGSALVLAQAGDWAPRTDYTILTAQGGVSGQFALASASLAFLEPVLDYGAHAVILSLERNDIDFAEIGHTRNQRAAASGARALGWGHPVFDAVVTLDAPTARRAFDALSGELYASARTARFTDSRYVREAMNLRLRDADTAGDTAAPLGHSAGAVWMHGWGHWGDRDGDGNAARLQLNGSGFLMGVDARVGDGGRVGASLGGSQQSLKVRDRASSAHQKATWAGLYGGVGLGALHLRAGAAYAWGHTDATRHVSYPGLTETVGARAHDRVEQIYAEGAWRIATVHGHVAPYLHLAHVRVHEGGVRETGGAAALNGDGSDSHASHATLGVRGVWNLGSADRPIRLHGDLGWRQAFGTHAPTSRLHFGGSDAFVVAGLPLAQHAVSSKLGLDFAVSKHASFDVSYSGMFAGDIRDQGGRMTLTVAF